MEVDELCRQVNPVRAGTHQSGGPGTRGGYVPGGGLGRPDSLRVLEDSASAGNGRVPSPSLRVGHYHVLAGLVLGSRAHDGDDHNADGTE
jgi:hypothetical protein